MTWMFPRWLFTACTSRRRISIRWRETWQTVKVAGDMARQDIDLLAGRAG